MNQIQSLRSASFNLPVAVPYGPLVKLRLERLRAPTLTDASNSGVHVTKSVLTIIALSMTPGATSVWAQTYGPRYPACMHVYGELEGERMDCIFTSLAQCQASAVGRAAMCLINPYFSSAPGRRMR